MNPRRAAAPRGSKTTRRWHIPPPLLHGPEPLEGGAVLEEIEGNTGLVLWQALRDVLLWNQAAPEDRIGLFAPGASGARRAALAGTLLPAGCRAPLEVIATLVERPESADVDAVSAACEELSAWAEERDALATALAFAQNAALVGSSQPGRAFRVAALAVLRADHARAEVWFRRAVGVARQARDWRTYSRAFGGLGNLYRSRGNLPAAHRFHLRALRGARRGGLRSERAAALHDLFAVAVEAGRTAEAERLARQALEAYGSRDPRVAVLAHDVAYFWMEHGHFARALPIMQAVLPRIERPVERLWAEADLARAAAGAGQESLARRAAEAVHERCGRPEMAAGAARALLELSRALLQLHDRDGARAAAAEALRLAVERREGKTRLMAEAALDAAGSVQAPPPPSSDAASDLADEMIRTLQSLAVDPSSSRP